MSFNDSTLLIRCKSQYIIPRGLILKTDDRHTFQKLNVVILKLQHTIARNLQN
jgi:hypothetical protein